MKHCNVCVIRKPLSEFYADKTYSDGRKNTCKPCLRKRQQKYKADNRERILQRRKQIRQQRKKTLVTLSGGECKICGYNKCLDALVFHHNYPELKEYTIGYLLTKRFTDEILNEITKCTLLCCNCHAEVHAGRNL